MVVLCKACTVIIIVAGTVDNLSDQIGAGEMGNDFSF
jgi:hypothetical protein